MMEGLLRCRGCLGPVRQGGRAGLCGRCWDGLAPLPEERCVVCALVHPWAAPCPEPVAWTWGDAFWDYHAGRPPLGALLVPGIKRGEMGWKAALLDRVSLASLPDFARDADVVCSAPTAFFRRWRRGFDLPEETGILLARRLGKPFVRLLRKAWFARAQTGLPESERRRLAGTSVAMAGNLSLKGEGILLVDDVWTTGTTLLRCAQVLARAGAGEVRVMTLFRAQSRRRAR